MKLQGEVLLPAPPERLWEMLLDPTLIAEILPGCRDLKQEGENRYTAVIEARVGPISSQYQTRFSITEAHPYESYRLKIEGDGKGGFVRGEARVTLHREGEGTRLQYEGEGMVGGMMARIGQRLVEAAAKMLIQRGFEDLKRKVEERLSADSAR